MINKAKATTRVSCFAIDLFFDSSLVICTPVTDELRKLCSRGMSSPTAECRGCRRVFLGIRDEWRPDTGNPDAKSEARVLLGETRYQCERHAQIGRRDNRPAHRVDRVAGVSSDRHSGMGEHDARLDPEPCTDVQP